jgi:hypothetical protein
LQHFGKIRKILLPIRCFACATDHPDRRRDCAREGRIDMNIKTLAKLLAFSGAAMNLATVPGLADNPHSTIGACRHVGGGILTNFLDPKLCMHTTGSPANLCTDGTATGDLKGAVGVQVLTLTPTATGLLLHNQHHWVTESGDTIVLNLADLTAYTTPDDNRVLADYLSGIGIAGGTGAFDGATGTIFAFGAADLNLGQVTLRYAGTICFAAGKDQ